MNCRFCGNKNDSQRLNCCICGKLIDRRVIDSFDKNSAVFEPPCSPEAPHYFEAPQHCPESHPVRVNSNTSDAASGCLISDTGGNVPFGPFLPERPFTDTLKVNTCVSNATAKKSASKTSKTNGTKATNGAKTTAANAKKKSKAKPLTPAQLQLKRYKNTRNTIVIIMLLIVAAMAWYLLLYNGVFSCNFIPDEFINGFVMPVIHNLSL